MFLILVWFGGFKDLIKRKSFLISIIILMFWNSCSTRNLMGRSEQRF